MIYLTYRTVSERDLQNELAQVITSLWLYTLKGRRDEQPFDSYVMEAIKTQVLDGEWNKVLDACEDYVRYFSRGQLGKQIEISEHFNTIFTDNLVAFRFIDGVIASVGSEVDSDAVSNTIAALTELDQYEGARQHIKRATQLLADRETPDYLNSIKESISAVESMVKVITGNDSAVLGRGLRQLENGGVTIHPVLKEGWIKLYGWTSDEGGIRHAMTQTPASHQALAKYMLVSCSAFVSYLVEVHASWAASAAS